MASYSYLAKIKSKLFANLTKELEIADQEDNIQGFLDKYGISMEEDYVPVNTRTMKILVFGALAGNVESYKAAARSMGISPNNFEFESDYDKLKNYDTARLMDSQIYSDIIFGPNPHKQVNTDGYSSFLSKINANPHRYPRVIPARDAHGLKLSITAFKECFYKTRYFENLES